MSIENVPWAKVETLMVSPNTRIVARLHVEWIGMAKARVAPALQPITESKVKIKKKKESQGWPSVTCIHMGYSNPRINHPIQIDRSLVRNSIVNFPNTMLRLTRK